MRPLNVAESIDVKKLVELTDGCTGADIKAICTEAGMYAIRAESETITEKHFIDAIAKVLKKVKDKSIDSGIYA